MCLAQGRIGCETLRQAWFWLFAPLSQGSRLSTIPASENLSIEYTPLYLEQGVSFSPFYVILWRFRPKPQLRINRTSCHEWVTLSCKISILLERPLTSLGSGSCLAAQHSESWIHNLFPLLRAFFSLLRAFFSLVRAVLSCVWALSWVPAWVNRKKQK